MVAIDNADPVPAPPGASPLGRFEASPLSAAISADLEPIFAAWFRQTKSLRNERRAAEPRLRRRGSGAAAPATPGARLGRIGLTAAAALLGLAAGGMLTERQALFGAAKPQQLAAAAPAVAQTSAPAGSPASAPPPLWVALPRKGAAPVGATADSGVRKVAAARPATSKTVRTPAKRRAKAGGYDQMLAADGQVRRAYAAAIRAGVPHRVLEEYRDDWARARRRAARDPAGTTQRYLDLATDLRRRSEARVVRADYRR